MKAFRRVTELLRCFVKMSTKMVISSVDLHPSSPKRIDEAVFSDQTCDADAARSGLVLQERLSIAGYGITRLPAVIIAP